MKYEVTLDPGVDFAPSDEAREVLQNVRTILTTRRGTVPLARDFGLTWDQVDSPTSVVMMRLRSEIIDAIETYEPRATVVSVDFDENLEDAMDGVLTPRVTVSIGDEVTT